MQRVAAATATASRLLAPSGTLPLLLQQQQQAAQHQLPWLDAASTNRQRRQYSADAPEPLIVPAASTSQQQQKQQTQPALQQPREVALELPQANQGPWERVSDKASGQTYWWNKHTNVTTPVGASRPDAWVAVVDEKVCTYVEAC